MIPLQLCPGGDFASYMNDFQFVKAVSCTYVEASSLLLVGMMVYFAIGGAIYIRTGSVVIPFILLLLTGGAIMSQISSVALQFVVLLVLLVPAGAFAYLYYRYSF